MSIYFIFDYSNKRKLERVTEKIHCLHLEKFSTKLTKFYSSDLIIFFY